MIIKNLKVLLTKLLLHIEHVSYYDGGKERLNYPKRCIHSHTRQNVSCVLCYFYVCTCTQPALAPVPFVSVLPYLSTFLLLVEFSMLARRSSMLSFVCRVVTWKGFRKKQRVALESNSLNITIRKSIFFFM